jgi:lipoate-protein ligase B
VITLGVRAALEVDAPAVPEGVEIVEVDRGGQATLHNPGQLVIFPVLDVRRLGARVWVESLARATQRLAWECGAQVLKYDPLKPGLYDEHGAKVAAIGVRIRHGVSTHGIALNISNDLNDFSWIRACGRVGAPMAHLKAYAPLAEMFALWVRCLQAEVDKAAQISELEPPSLRL